MDRRKFIKTLSFTSIGSFLFQSPILRVSHLFASHKPYDISYVINKDTKAAVKKAIDLIGGIKKFVKKGDVVILKPNISWAREPEYAATTNPIVLKTAVEMCFDAGAKQVKITDNTCANQRKSFALSGAEDVARQTGADLFYKRSRDFKTMDINGKKLKKWSVNKQFVDADVLINIPIAKSHKLSKLTIGMKNWFGAVGGSRTHLHQDINQTIADLANFFKPAFTLVDASRILVKNGPTGGNLKDVKQTNTIIASIDPIAADSWAATLFGLKGTDLEYVVNGQKMGIGTYDYKKLRHKKV